MAKSISNPNIAVTVNTGDVKPKVDEVNKSLGQITGKPIDTLAKDVNADLTAVNKDIRSTIENLYKLRAELAKGGDTSKLTQQLKNQLGKIDKGATGKGTASKDDGKALKDAGQTANDLLGGKFDLGKAAKFGVAGIVGSIVSDLGAAVTDALVEVGNNRRTYDAGQRGGVQGKVERANAEYDNTASTLAADARKQKLAIDEQLKAQIAAQEKGAKDTGQSRRPNDAAANARKSADQNIKLLKAAAQQRADEIDVEVKAKLTFEGKKRDDTIGLAKNTSPDVAATEDAIEALKKQTATLDGDPFAAMRKSIASLKPGATLLGVYDEELAKYKDRLDEVADEAKKFNATKLAEDIVKNAGDTDSLIGKSGIDRQVQQLRNDGVADDVLAKVKVTLDTTEAKQRAEELKQTLQAIGSNIKVTLARTDKLKIAAEIEAESDRRKTATGQGYTDAEKAQLQKAKEDESAASRAAQTRESVKDPAEKLGESIESLKEQFARGYITDAELGKGVGQQLQGYADSMRTNRPDLIEAGSAAAQQLTAVGTGAAIDASRPELVIAREQKDLLGEIRDAIKDSRPVKVSIGG